MSADLSNPIFWAVVGVFSFLVLAMTWSGMGGFSDLKIKILFTILAPLCIFGVCYFKLD